MKKRIIALNILAAGLLASQLSFSLTMNNAPAPTCDLLQTGENVALFNVSGFGASEQGQDTAVVSIPMDDAPQVYKYIIYNTGSNGNNNKLIDSGYFTCQNGVILGEDTYGSNPNSNRNFAGYATNTKIMLSSGIGFGNTYNPPVNSIIFTPKNN